MKKRIAFISEHASPLTMPGETDNGGQNVYVAELAKEMAQRGYEVDVFTRRDREDLPEVIAWLPGIRVVYIQAGDSCPMPKEILLPYMEEFFTNMLAFMQREKSTYALIHANFWMSAMVASWLKDLLGIPFIVTFHALGYIRKLYQKEMDKFPPERVEIERQAIENADRIIAECPQDREDLIRFYAAPPEKISIVPCGFNPWEFYPVDKEVARRLLGLPAQKKIILQLGRLVPRKGIDNVIRAVARLKRSGLSLLLVIVGGSSCENEAPCEEQQRLQRIAEEEQVSDLVLFAGGKCRDMLKFYYSAADLFITTPWYEPFGITPLEAMACGTPVIGSNVGGIKYSVLDSVTGSLVPPRDPEQLSLKIRKLIRRPLLVSRMKKAAIRRVNDHFTWHQVADVMAGIYEQIMVPLPGPINEKLFVIHTREQEENNYSATIEL